MIRGQRINKYELCKGAKLYVDETYEENKDKEEFKNKPDFILKKILTTKWRDELKYEDKIPYIERAKKLGITTTKKFRKEVLLNQVADDDYQCINITNMNEDQILDYLINLVNT